MSYNTLMPNATLSRKNRIIKTNISATTSGRGLWTQERKTVNIHSVKFMPVIYDEPGRESGAMYIEAYFDRREWNTHRDGLIYTDQKWMREFRQGFFAQFPELREVDANIDYSEQGAQGPNYVHIVLVADKGKKFDKFMKFLRQYDLMATVELL